MSPRLMGGIPQTHTNTPTHPKSAMALVAMSKVSGGPSDRGIPKAIGFVPNTGLPPAAAAVDSGEFARAKGGWMGRLGESADKETLRPRKHTCTHARTHAQMRVSADARKQKRRNACKRKRKRAHTHTYTR